MAKNGELVDEAGELELARKLSRDAHQGQFDNTGRPYFDHCARVADLVQGTKEKTVAFLHDIVEKCEEWNLDSLRQLGIGDDVVSAVDALTLRADETDDQFVIRAVANKLACPVKIADLQDNLQQANAAGSDPGKYKRGLELVAMIQANPDLTRLT